MATDLERLVVSLEASITKFEKEMKRSRQVSDGAMRDVERSVTNGQKRVEAAMARIGGSIKAGIVGVLAGLSLQQVTEFADRFTKVQNALKVTGLQGRELNATYEQLFAAAQRQAAPIEAMATLYGRLSVAQKDLNATAPELMRFTEGVATALRVSGQSSQEASGALLQLAQAMAGGKVQAEEYNSLIDGARPVLMAVAAGLKEAGGSVSALTALVKDGKVSSEAFFRAFQAGQGVLDTMAAQTTPTASQGLQRVSNAMTDLIGKMDQAVGASQGFQSAINFLADEISRLPEVLQSAVHGVELLTQAYADLKAVGQAALASVGITDPQSRFDQVFDANEAAVQGSMRGYKPKAQTSGAMAFSVKPGSQVSLANYPVPGEDKAGKKARENEYQREIAQIKERTAALQQESTTVGQSAAEIAKAEAAFRLLEAAKKANVAITPELKADIESVAAAYGEATAALEDARKAQEQFNELQQFVGESISGFLSDIVSGGKNAEEALMNLTKRLADMALQAALLGQGPLAGLFGTAGANGGVGGLIGALFKGFMPGRASGGPVKAGQAYTVGETGRETFIPTTPGRIIPNGKTGGGSMQVVINNNAGAQVSTRQTNGPQGPRLEVQIEQMLSGMIAGGKLDKSLKGRFGVNPMGGR